MKAHLFMQQHATTIPYIFGTIGWLGSTFKTISYKIIKKIFISQKPKSTTPITPHHIFSLTSYHNTLTPMADLDPISKLFYNNSSKKYLFHKNPNPPRQNRQSIFLLNLLS
jgi:hypothetical protein